LNGDSIPAGHAGSAFGAFIGFNAPSRSIAALFRNGGRQRETWMTDVDLAQAEAVRRGLGMQCARE
jgi:hypothetical protein